MRGWRTARSTRRGCPSTRNGPSISLSRCSPVSGGVRNPPRSVAAETWTWESMIMGRSFSPRDLHEPGRVPGKAPRALGGDLVLLAEHGAGSSFLVHEVRMDGDDHPRDERARVAVAENRCVMV